MITLKLPQRRLSPWQQTILLCILATIIVHTAQAQNTSTLRTDPSEARALNTMLFQWGIASTNRWNISGELCSGIAIDATSVVNINPGIKCNCSYSGNTTCHITALWVHDMDLSGPLPEELWTLTYLVNLNLAHNYLTGPIPPSIRNLNRTQYLNISTNALTGELPWELGLLTDLISLSLSTNNFSGDLPSELGGLSRLTQLYFDSSGVSGRIPRRFAELWNLQTVWASDNELTGLIPEFIGNWTNLVNLLSESAFSLRVHMATNGDRQEARLQGNSFQGPIPTSFSSLTSLNDLRISEVLNGTSSLDFLRNLNSLNTLILRNNNISGTIPSFLSAFQNLSLLDLSFNNLGGRIPDTLFNLVSLNHLFLGNNMLTSTLPLQKRLSLRNIDLSYNQLSGRFPSWITEPNLQVNLVANNFMVENSGSRLECLQSNFLCNRELPVYSSFAINCGGPEIRSNNQVVYEMDNETLGPAAYYVSSTRRWAVSNSGFPSDSNSPHYQTSSLSQFTNTSDSDLFQTARVSAGSLRYYGLGLENGNYTVTLEFSETTFSSNRTWRSLGRRVFDIYIQGNLEIRDFDIQRDAAGMSFRAFVREFTTTVRNNYLEIHLFWAGKGTCCVPAPGTYGPTVSAIRATPDFVPTIRNINPLSPSRHKTGLVVGVVVAVGITSLLSIATLCYVYQRRKKQKNLEDEVFLGMDARPNMYTYAELKAATDDFNPSKKLGEGGFGSVYQGTLGDGQVVAIKQLSVASHHGKSQFVAEIATISAVQHRNLVKLYGCCIEGTKRLLVYEYLENRSLDKHLFGVGNNSSCLDWLTRCDICLGVAKGLAYLHEESRLRIVHRDVKASNILLDSNFTPKISDFGLAKLGYLAPEYAMLGRLTEKADIFSFGVVTLELISGRPNSVSNVEDDKIYLLEWAWNVHEKETQIELVDPNLREFEADTVKRIIGIGLLCTQASPGLRPSMSRVVGMLTGDIVPSVTSKPGYLTDWRFDDQSFINEIGTSTPNPDGRYTDMSTGTTMLTDPDISLIEDGR